MKLEADTLKIRCLKEIASMEQSLQSKSELTAVQSAEPAQNSGLISASGASAVKDGSEKVPYAAETKKQKIVSIKAINRQTTWLLENQEDVKRYIAELEKELLTQLEEDVIVQVEF